jgi:hypothetical protein
VGAPRRDCALKIGDLHQNRVYDSLGLSSGPPSSSRLSVLLPANGAQSLRRADSLPASTAIAGFVTQLVVIDQIFVAQRYPEYALSD